jgi:multidrug resistance efflux pump
MPSRSQEVKETNVADDRSVTEVESANVDRDAAAAVDAKPSDFQPAEAGSAEADADPARRLTWILLCACLLLFIWYVLGDRFTPYTDQARVDGYIIPIVPEVSGIVVKVEVDINEIVSAGDVLIQIDPRHYELAVEEAEAALERAGQDIGAGTADVSSAQAKLADAKAQLATERVQAARRIHLEKEGAASKAEADRARALLSRAEAKLATAEAGLVKAREQLGAEGQDNAMIRASLAVLEKARLDLADTTIRAPSLGGVTNLQVDVGHHAIEGQPLMTFISANDVWVVANLRENSIGNVEPGDRAEILLDVAPGRIFQGRVVSIGYGVETQAAGTLGDLPTISSSSNWLRDAQRFPVVIRFADESARGLRRAGGQADVTIYTGDHVILNALGWLWMRLVSVLSYVY